jgi:hypothetical protein
MQATSRNNTSNESQTVSRTRLPYDAKKTNNDSQKLLRAIRRSMTESRNLKVVDALQLALNVLNETTPDGPSKHIDNAVDESTDSSDHSF